MVSYPFVKWCECSTLRKVILLCRVALGVMWVVSAVFKFYDLAWFTQAVRNYKFPPFDLPPYDYGLAYGLPVLEVLVGGCLIISFRKVGALVISGLLLVTFLAPILHAWKWGYDISCGCVGVHSGDINYPVHVAALLIGVIFIIGLIAFEIKTSDINREQER